MDTGGTAVPVRRCRKLSEFLVRLGFVSRLALPAATRRRWVGRLPEIVILTSVYLVRRDGGGWESLGPRTPR